jgi:hypothetical protein
MIAAQPASIRYLRLFHSQTRQGQALGLARAGHGVDNPVHVLLCVCEKCVCRDPGALNQLINLTDQHTGIVQQTNPRLFQCAAHNCPRNCIIILLT